VRVDSSRLVHGVVKQLANYNEQDFVPSGVVKLPVKSTPAETQVKQHLLARYGNNTPTPISGSNLHAASDEAPLLMLMESPVGSEYHSIGKGAVRGKPFNYSTHRDRDTENTRLHALNIFMRQRKLRHITLGKSSSTGHHNACAYCTHHIFASEKRLVCDQCSLSFHLACTPAANRARPVTIHLGDVNYTYNCSECMARNAWMEPAVRTESDFNSHLSKLLPSEEMLVLHPRGLTDTVIIALTSLMVEYPGSISFPIQSVWAFIKKHWNEVKPISVYRNALEDEDNAEKVPENHGRTVAEDEIASYRTRFRALLECHPAFEVLDVGTVRLSETLLASGVNG
jgi:hypothetical protein